VVLWCATFVVFFVNLEENELRTNRLTNIRIKHKYVNSETSKQAASSGNDSNLHSECATFESWIGAPAILSEVVRDLPQSH
jgi:hypothetical protein